MYEPTPFPERNILQRFNYFCDDVLEKVLFIPVGTNIAILVFSVNNQP